MEKVFWEPGVLPLVNTSSFEPQQWVGRERWQSRKVELQPQWNQHENFCCCYGKQQLCMRTPRLSHQFEPMWIIFRCQTISSTRRICFCSMCQVFKSTALSGTEPVVNKDGKNPPDMSPKPLSCFQGTPLTCQALLLLQQDHYTHLYLLHYLLDWHVLTQRAAGNAGAFNPKLSRGHWKAPQAEILWGLQLLSQHTP